MRQEVSQTKTPSRLALLGVLALWGAIVGVPVRRAETPLIPLCQLPEFLQLVQSQATGGNVPVVRTPLAGEMGIQMAQWEHPHRASRQDDSWVASDPGREEH